MHIATPTPPLCLAYYCSGHGYGHATRVSAFTRYLLSGSLKDSPIVYIVSSAPAHVFSDSIACGARYRYAEIDPVIVQPLAYRVDRRQSVEVLKKFLNKKDELLDREREWLAQINAHGVLSDAAFLGCLAARAAGLPSVLITNFSFDSVYSYLSTPLLDISPPSQYRVPSILDMLPDVSIPHVELAPLVEQIHAGYRCADLLVRLPGYIPIPSFFVNPKLPSSEWIDAASRRMRPEVLDHLNLSSSSSASALLPCLPPILPHPRTNCTMAKRTVIDAPLLVRPPSSDLSVYTPAGRSKLLSSIGVPVDLHDPSTTKILIVSFGGQVFRPPPSRASSRAHSRNASHENIAGLMSPPSKSRSPSRSSDINGMANPGELNTESKRNRMFQENISSPSRARFDLHIPASPRSPTPSGCDTDNALDRRGRNLDGEQRTSRLATPGHIWIPGAPPASKPPPTTPVTQPASDIVGIIPSLNTIPPTPRHEEFEADPHSASFAKLQIREHDEHAHAPHDDTAFNPDDTNSSSSNSDSSSSSISMDIDSDTDVDAMDQGQYQQHQLLPDASWIAIVCGVSKEQWITSQAQAGGAGGEEGLPEGFYVAPRDVYMPDLTAVGDVLLGKLGYGTVSECVDACTPFVYVSRPLFIEEHGLRLLLDKEGVGVELSRQSYEAGDWACAVGEALEKGREAKKAKRRVMGCDSGGVGKDRRDQEGRRLAGQVVDWVRGWWSQEEGKGGGDYLGVGGGCRLDEMKDS